MVARAKTLKHEVAHLDDDAGEDRTIEDAVIITPSQSTPWVDVAMSDIGLQEIRGRRHNDAIVQMFADAGHDWVQDDETAWCAAAVCAWLERAGHSSPKTLAARGFLKWGREIDEPVPGCIVVMWRGSPHGWQGHVGIYMGEAQGGRAIRVLGGNQRNAVNVAEFSKYRKYKGKTYPAVLSYRMPRKALKTQVAAATNAVVAGGTAATGAAIAAAQSATDAVRPTAEALTQTGNPAATSFGLWVIVALSLVGAGIAIYTAWQRGADFKARGV